MSRRSRGNKKADFLPISLEDMIGRGWNYYDFLLVTADAYVDHPSFGAAVISRLVESLGYRVCVLAQPDWKSADAFKALGRPRYGVLISGGNLDSMVAHYTAAKKKRGEDYYSPGSKAGLRPDRATIVYANRAREAFPDIPIVIGGLEGSLRRFAHYDYWEDKVRRSILFDAKADILCYGMGERSMSDLVKRLADGESVKNISDVRGTALIVKDPEICEYERVFCPSFEEVSRNKKAYAGACKIQYDEHDPIVGRAVLQACADRYLLVNPPAMPLTTKGLDSVAELPYTREPHPVYEGMGGVAAIEEVRFSVIHNRGCIGACNFCALAFHQGRMISSRSHQSVIKEVTEFTKHPLFKGYVHDVGGPTANFRRPACKKQLKNGFCKDKSCLAPKPCAQLDTDHSDYLTLLRKLRAIPGVKKVFIRSGIRFDFLMLDKNGDFFAELVRHHISGQLKVAPEHCIDDVLHYMNKPGITVYESFLNKYKSLNARYGKNQFLVPYLMSSHPGSTLADAVRLAEYLNRAGVRPEQVQDFYPTPGTLSTCMYYTGIDPRTMKTVYVPREFREKRLQRALLQWTRPEKRGLVTEALKKAGREDLIGYGKRHLVRPEPGARARVEGKRRNRPPEGDRAGKSGGRSPQRQGKRADFRSKPGKKSGK